MPTQLTADDARQSLNAHVEAKGGEIRAKYGPHIGWKELQQVLGDRTCVRYPCEVVFEAAPLQAGEFACALTKGARPEEGYTIVVHPLCLARLDRVLHAILYQLVVVNYGEFASADDAETFGASVLGIAKDEYYLALCELADELAGSSMA